MSSFCGKISMSIKWISLIKYHRLVLWGALENDIVWRLDVNASTFRPILKDSALLNWGGRCSEHTNHRIWAVPWVVWLFVRHTKATLDSQNNDTMDTFTRIMTIIQHYSTSRHHTSSYIIIHHHPLHSRPCSYIHIIQFPSNSLFSSLSYPTSTPLQNWGQQHPTHPDTPGEFVIRSNSSKRNCVSRWG